MRPIETVLTSAVEERGQPKELTVYLFNVGQGDHILLELPNGEFGIIDFYYEISLGWKKPPALTYLDYLKSRDPSRKIVISFICISHPDRDHLKGIDYFLEWIKRNEIELKRFWLFAGGDFEELVARYWKAYEQTRQEGPVHEKSKKLRNRLAGIQRFLGDWDGIPDYLQDIRKLADSIGGVKVILIAPLGDHVREYDEQAWADLFQSILEDLPFDTSAQRNLMSSVLLMVFKEHRLLFGGDTGERIWQECLDKYEELNMQAEYGPCRGRFVKVSHHGSRNSSSLNLWKRLLLPGKSLSGISAGRHEGYKHPHAETLADIFAVASELKGDPKRFSTNICRDCVLAEKMPEERFDWLPDRRFIATTKTGSRTKAEAQQSHKAAENLAAYVLRFNSQSSDITLSKAVSSTINERVQCIYGSPGRGPFPDCAVSQDTA
jgi:beta-lactamase superfamily II metal-dependent hydrolase